MVCPGCFTEWRKVDDTNIGTDLHCDKPNDRYCQTLAEKEYVFRLYVLPKRVACETREESINSGRLKNKSARRENSGQGNGDLRSVAECYDK